MPTESWNQSVGDKAYRTNTYGAVTITNKENYTVSQSRTSVRTPGFHKGSRRAMGDLPMNPFSFSRAKLVRPHCNPSVKIQYWGWPGMFYTDTYSGNCYGVVGVSWINDYGIIHSPTSAEISAMEAQAINKLLLKVKDQKVNLAQALAERAQTADLIAVTAKRFAEAIVNLRRGNYRAAANAVGIKASRRKVSRYNRSYKRDQSSAVSSGWLELQYGWKPLLSDIYGSAEFLAQKMSSEIIDKASISLTRKFAKTITTESVPGYSEWKRVAYGECEYTIKYVVFFSSSSSVHTLAQTGFSNPALIAWELMPWSFVLDWFIPIGNYLSSLDATLGVSFMKGSKTVFTKRYGHTIDTVNQPVVYTGMSFKKGSVIARSESVDCVRTAMSSFPSPQIPSFKNPVSFDHVANALALLRQAFKR